MIPKSEIKNLTKVRFNVSFAKLKNLHLKNNIEHFHSPSFGM